MGYPKQESPGHRPPPPPLKCTATLFLVLFETLGPGLNAVVRNEDRAKEEDFFFKMNE